MFCKRTGEPVVIKPLTFLGNGQKSLSPLTVQQSITRWLTYPSEAAIAISIRIQNNAKYKAIGTHSEWTIPLCPNNRLIIHPNGLAFCEILLCDSSISGKKEKNNKTIINKIWLEIERIFMRRSPTKKANTKWV